jgi:hypothetical protein
MSLGTSETLDRYKFLAAWRQNRQIPVLNSLRLCCTVCKPFRYSSYQHCAAHLEKVEFIKRFSNFSFITHIIFSVFNSQIFFIIACQEEDQDFANEIRRNEVRHLRMSHFRRFSINRTK